MKKITPPDQSQRDLILRELDAAMLVEAAAGTGKTTCMVGRMIALLASGRCDIAKMAAITFTRKAAAELRARFRLELEIAARGAEDDAAGDSAIHLSEALSRVERCSITTIHSFCAGLLRERPIEAGLDVGFEEIEPEEDARLREESWDEYVSALYADDAPIIEELAGLGVEISALRQAYIRLADYPDVAEWPASAASLPDLSPAADELKKYASHMEKVSSKFGDPGNDALMPKYFLIPRMMRSADIARPAELLKILEVTGGSPKIVQKNWPGGKEEAIAEKKRWDEFGEKFAEPLKKLFLARRYDAILRAARPALELYERRKADSGRLNYEDLLMRAAALLRSGPNVRRYFRARFTHLLVDEFQDTDPVQAEVMLLLTSIVQEETNWIKCRPAPGSLFVVGDPKQSIYRFRRADIVTYNRVRQIIRESGGLVVGLQANFRAAAPLIEWVNDAFSGAFPADANVYSPPGREMMAGRTDSPEADLTGIKKIVIPEHLKNKNEIIEYEADFIARTIRRALDEGLTVPRSQKELGRGVAPRARPGDFLIVTRNTTGLGDYARKLREYDIPHQVTGGSALNQTPRLAALHTCLAAAARPEDPIALVAALRSELFGVSDAQLYDHMKAGGGFSIRTKIPKNLDEETRTIFVAAFRTLGKYAEWLNRLPPVVVVEKIAADTGLLPAAASGHGGDEQAGSICKAIEILRAAQPEMWTAVDIVERLGRIIRGEEKHDGIPARPPEPDVVRVMNLHKVKGLEAPVVFLANATDNSEHPVEFHIDRTGEKVRGYIAVRGEPTLRGAGPVIALPEKWDELSREEENFDAAEKTRLLYVAATRAGAMLAVVVCEKNRNRNPWDYFSSFVEDCPPLEDPGEAKPAVAGKQNVNQADAIAETDQIGKRWKYSKKPTYASEEAKKYALHGKKIPAAGAGLGLKWGKTIHRLLKVAGEKAEADLRRMAISSFIEQDEQDELSENRALLVEEAIKTVRAVKQSDIWKRAAGSEAAFYEIPILSIQPDTKKYAGFSKILLGGEIDLVFKENGKWVIADYKTGGARGGIERLFNYYMNQLRVYKDMWRDCVNEPVGEIGIFFVDAGEYMSITL